MDVCTALGETSKLLHRVMHSCIHSGRYVITMSEIPLEMRSELVVVYVH